MPLEPFVGAAFAGLLAVLLGLLFPAVSGQDNETNRQMRTWGAWCAAIALLVTIVGLALGWG